MIKTFILFILKIQIQQQQAMIKSNSKYMPKSKNQTIGALYHLNHKHSSQKLNQTIRSFKTQKPQVKSSRIETSHTYSKKESKSIESQEAKHHERTQKSVRKVSLQNYKNIQISLESRLRSLEKIFSHKEFSFSEGKQKTEDSLIIFRNKFGDFESFMQERKLKMVFDDIDKIIEKMIGEIQKLMTSILESIFSEQQMKITQLKKGFKQVIQKYEIDLDSQQRIIQQEKNARNEVIEQLITKSLVSLETINHFQKKGKIDFDLMVRETLGIHEEPPLLFKDQRMAPEYTEKQKMHYSPPEYKYSI